MAVYPTRLMNRATPLDMMTVDQMLLIHGPHPVHKEIPARAPGPPRTREEVEGEIAARSLYGTQHGTQSPPAMRFADGDPHEIGFVGGPPPIPVRSEARSVPTERPGRPQNKARLKPLAVAPTDPDYQGPWTPQPCRAPMEMEIELDGVGIVVFPVECETVGAHPNQPHLGRIYGTNPLTGRSIVDVFVGWSDEER